MHYVDGYIEALTDPVKRQRTTHMIGSLTHELLSGRRPYRRYGDDPAYVVVRQRCFRLFADLAHRLLGEVTQCVCQHVDRSHLGPVRRDHFRAATQLLRPRKH